MSQAAVVTHAGLEPHQPDPGVVGMICLIAAETAIFVIFLVAYVYYTGRSLSGPSPRDVLDLPVFTTVCLLSSSFTVHRAVAALRRGETSRCGRWLAATVLLGSIFLAGTAREWYGLIYSRGFTIQTNLFGTTFYSLVGLHATHVIAGLTMLGLALLFAMRGSLTVAHAKRLDVLSLYWHFVDAVWVVVFSVVYVLSRQGNG